MKEIKILGTGCPKCNQLYKLVEQAANEILLDYKIEKVTDIQEITSYDVMSTPALVVDGVVKSAGKIPALDKMKELLQ